MSELFYYPRYINDWRASRARLEMTPEQRNLYWELLDYFYQFGFIPNSESEMRRIAGFTKSEFKRSWPKVSQWFEERGDVLVQSKSEVIRAKLLDIQEKRSRAGKSSRKNLRQFRASDSPALPVTHSPALPVTHSPALPVTHSPAHRTDTHTGYRARANSETHKLKGSTRAGRELPEASSETDGARSASPSVGSHEASRKKPQKKSGKGKQRSSLSAPDGSAGAGSSLTHNSSATTQNARIVSLNGTTCEVEVMSDKGLQLLSMAIADAERMLSKPAMPLPEDV